MKKALQRLLKSKHIYLLLFFGFLFLLPFFWVTNSRGIISGNDYNWIVDWQRQLSSSFFIWNDTLTPSFLPQIPLLLFNAFFYIVNFFVPNWVIPAFFIALLFVISAFLMYYFLNTILSVNGHIKTFVALLGAIFYALNFYTYTKIHDGHETLLLIYAVIPLVLANIYKYTENKLTLNNFFLTILFFSLFIPPSAYNVPLEISALLFIFIFSFYLAVCAYPHWQKVKKIIFAFVAFFALHLLLSMWWLLPLIIESKTQRNLMMPVETNVLSQTVDFELIMHSSQSSFLNLFRGFGYWPFHTDFFSVSVKYLSGNLLLIFISFIPFILISCLFFFRQKNLQKLILKRHVIFFSAILMLFLFLSKGIHEPFSNIYKWLYFNIPFFWFFRSNHIKLYWSVAFSASILVSVFFGIVLSMARNNRRKNKIFVGIFLFISSLAYIYYIFPFFDGSIIEKKRSIVNTPLNDYSHGDYTRLISSFPKYYEQFKNYLDLNKNNFRILHFPPAGYISYDWNYHGENPLLRYTYYSYVVPTYQTTFNSTYGYNDFIFSSLYTNLKQENSSIFSKSLKFGNVKYILLQNDYIPDAIEEGKVRAKVNDPEYIKNFLNKENSLQLKQTFDKLDLYEVKDEFFRPRIYASTQLSYATDDLFVIGPKILSQKNFDNKQDIVFNAAQNFITSKNQQIFINPSSVNKDPNNNTIIFNIPAGAQPKDEYELLIDKSVPFADTSPNISLRINYQGKLLSKKREDNQFIYYGDTPLKTGAQNIILLNPFKNQISNNSFEEGVWEGVYDCHNYDNASEKEIKLKVDTSTNAIEGKKSLLLSTLKHTACAGKDVSDFNANRTYQISFYYKNISGTPPRIRLTQYGEEVQQKELFYDLPANPIWQYFTTQFTPDVNATGLNLAFFSQENSKEQLTTNLFDEVEVKSILTQNDLLLQSISKKKAIDSTPQIEFTRINPVKYRVSVKEAKNPYSLVLLENFATGWNATINKDRQTNSVSEQNHFKINGYANAWYITDEGDYEIMLYYAQQRYVYVGIAISSATIFGFLIFVIYRKFKIKKKIHA